MNLKIKISRLHEERIAELEGLKGTQKDIAWGFPNQELCVSSLPNG